MCVCVSFVLKGEILSHVDGTDRYTRMRYRKKVQGLTSDGHFDEKHSALYFVDIMHGLAYLHRYGCNCNACNTGFSGMCPSNILFPRC